INSACVRLECGCVALAKVSVFHDGCQPRWPIRKLVDLDWLLDNDAVGAHPRTRPHSHVDHITISYVADIWLGVNGDWRFLPGVELSLSHGDRRSLRSDVVGE